MSSSVQSLDLHGAFSGKTIFFTGVTGFVGKVFLFLLLKNFPDLKRIYVLIRTKKGQSPQDRFAKEVLASQCFNFLKDSVGTEEFKRLCGLVVAVAGDITEDFLGIAKPVYAELCDQVNFIAHIAATVDFREKLNLSVQMNTLGALRVLSLAHKCKHLDAMVHTSTCYVNWARYGRDVPVKEELYPLPFDPEDMCKHILSIHDRYIPQETERLLTRYNYPNTYTFTKSMGEHLIRRDKGKLPVAIVRPAIIGCSYRDPCPGWVDALTAAGGLFPTVGLGIVGEMMMDPNSIADLIPVDHVCSILIKALFKTALHHRATNIPPPPVPTSPQAAVVAHANALGLVAAGSAKHGGTPPVLPLQGMVRPSAQPQAQLAGAASQPGKAESISSECASSFPLVFHAGTSSSLNRCTWLCCKEAVEHFWNTGKRHPRAIRKARIDLEPNALLFYTTLAVRSILPYYAMKVASYLPPPIGGEAKRKLLGKFEKALERAADMRVQFYPFVSKEWIFDQSNLKILNEGLSAKAMEAFASDAYSINWWTYVELYNYGLCKFIINSVDGRTAPVIPRSGAEVFVRASL